MKRMSIESTVLVSLLGGLFVDLVVSKLLFLTTEKRPAIFPACIFQKECVL